MYLVKTAAGQQAFKERHADFPARMRPAFLLFDGQRSLSQVLQATSSLGVSAQDVQAMVDQQWLQERPGKGAAASPSTSQSPESGPGTGSAAARSRQECYQQAYPLAVSLTSALGLKGLRLNLAVESAMGFEQLLALAPRIKQAVGEDAFAPLNDILAEQSPSSSA